MRNTMSEAGYKGPLLVISNRLTFEHQIFYIAEEHGTVSTGLNIYAQKYLLRSAGHLKNEDRIAKEYYEANGMYYYSPVESLCPDDICKIFDNKKPLYYDKSHLTLTGSKLIGKDLVRYIQKTFINKK